MWQPDGNSLEILVDLLKQAQSNDNTKQKEIYKQFNQLSKNPEFCNYLIYILSLKSESNIEVLRQTAGVVLKGVIERFSSEALANSLEFLQKHLFETFADPSTVIRSTVTFVMASLSMKIGHKNWPALIKFLGEILITSNTPQEYVESSLDCILKIVEDIKMNTENIQGLDDPNDPINQLIPLLIQTGASDVAWKVKALTIECLNAFTFIMSPVFISNMQKYMEILFYSGDHQHETVRLRSCQGFIELLATRKDLVNHHLVHVIERIVKFTMDSDKEVVHSSLKFWNEFIKVEPDEDSSRVRTIIPYLKTYILLKKLFSSLVPLFVDNCRYTEEDLMNLDNTKSKNASSNSQNVCNLCQKSFKLVFNDDEDEDGIQETDDDDNLGQDDGEWTLRRECAHQLDMLAREFGNEVFEYAQERIAANLQAKDWQTREGGMLAIGAVAKGAEESIYPHLNDIFPFLLQNTENENPLVRCMAIWTLSRFTKWILMKASEDLNVFKEYFVRVLKSMLDDHADTHKAACTAFSKLCNADTTAVVEFLSDIIEILKQVAEKYKGKQAGALYDVISTIGYNLDPSIVQSDKVEPVFMGILIKNWEISTFDDPESNLLIECTDSILGVIGDHINNYLEFFVPKLFILIANYLEAKKGKDTKTLYHKREIALRCLETYGSILKNIQGNIEKYINPQDFAAMIEGLCSDVNLISKQWVMSTIGETAKFAPNLIAGNIKLMLLTIADNLKTISDELGASNIILAVCNNAAWALGLVCVAFPKETYEYIPELIKRVVQLLTGSQKVKFLLFVDLKLHIILAQNLSIAIGRMALANTDAVAEYLPHFLKQFCLSIERTREEDEKNDALKGLFWAIAKNPNGIVTDFHFLCLALTSIDPKNQELARHANEIVHQFKNLAGNQWGQYYSGFPIELQQKMRICFGIND